MNPRLSMRRIDACAAASSPLGERSPLDPSAPSSACDTMTQWLGKSALSRSGMLRAVESAWSPHSPSPPRRPSAVAARLASPLHAAAWLVVLRWHALVGQASLALLASNLPGMHGDATLLSWAVTSTAVTNLALWWTLRSEPKVGDVHLTAILAFDIVALTVTLLGSGVAALPLTSLYFPLVTLAAILLRPRGWALLLVLCVVGDATVLACFSPEPSPERWMQWAGFVLTSGALAFAVSNLSAALRMRQAADTRRDQAEWDAFTLASLGHWAATAAHELNTPLGTIAVASGELEELIVLDRDQAIADARLIRSEVERCRSILAGMSNRAGVVPGEAPRSARIDEIFERIRNRLSTRSQASVAWDASTDVSFSAPLGGLTQVLASIIDNAIEAGSARVDVIARQTGPWIDFSVKDRAGGMPLELRNRIGQPFVTTKDAGRGLGLYLARTFAELCGGSLDVFVEDQVGTTVTLRLPGMAIS